MRLIRWAGENVSPSDDGRLYEKIFKDGIYNEFYITPAGGSEVNISPLYGIICGRDFTSDAMSINCALPSGTGEKSGVIYVECDTSKTDPLSVKSKIGTLTPTRENINVSGTVAQVAIGWYSATATGVTDAGMDNIYLWRDGASIMAEIDRVDDNMSSLGNSVDENTQAIGELNNGLTDILIQRAYSTTIDTIPANGTIQVSRSDLGIETISGYASLAIRAFETNNPNVIVRTANTSSTSAVLRVRNLSGSAVSNVTVSINIVFVKSAFLG